MSLLPEDTALLHLNPLLDKADESGLPVWREISADHAKRFILSKVALADVMKVDHKMIHDSYMLALKAGKSWGPWFIAEILLAKQEEVFRQRRLAQHEPKCPPVAQGIVDSGNVRYSVHPEDTKLASKMQREDDGPTMLRKVRAVQKETGNHKLTKWQAYLYLAKKARETT